MPSFEYKGKDSKGVPTAGTIEADSHGAAQNTLKARGIQVVLLKPASVAPARPAPAAPVVSPLNSPSNRRSDESHPWVPKIAAVVLLVAVLGGYGLYSRYRPWGSVYLAKGEQQRALEIKGRVAFEKPPKAADPWKRTRLTVFLPEVPAEFMLGNGDIRFNAVGDFTLKLFFLSSAAPHMVNLMVEQRGYKSQLLNQLKVPQEAEQALNLPPIVLQRTGTSGTPRRGHPSPAKSPSAPDPGTSTGVEQTED